MLIARLRRVSRHVLLIIWNFLQKNQSTLRVTRKKTRNAQTRTRMRVRVHARARTKYPARMQH